MMPAEAGHLFGLLTDARKSCYARAGVSTQVLSSSVSIRVHQGVLAGWLRLLFASVFAFFGPSRLS